MTAPQEMELVVHLKFSDAWFSTRMTASELYRCCQ